jgi:hypothetical protein
MILFDGAQRIGVKILANAERRSACMIFVAPVLPSYRYLSERAARTDRSRGSTVARQRAAASEFRAATSCLSHGLARRIQLTDCLRSIEVGTEMASCSGP